MSVEVLELDLRKHSTDHSHPTHVTLWWRFSNMTDVYSILCWFSRERPASPEGEFLCLFFLSVPVCNQMSLKKGQERPRAASRGHRSACDHVTWQPPGLAKDHFSFTFCSPGVRIVSLHFMKFDIVIISFVVLCEQTWSLWSLVVPGLHTGDLFNRLCEVIFLIFSYRDFSSAVTF